MDDGERWAAMAESLKAAELEIRRLRYDLIGRAMTYVSDGLPVGIVLDSLGISSATWFRRTKDYRERYVKPHSDVFFED